MKMTLKIVAASFAASIVLLSGCGGKKAPAAASEEVVPEHDFVSEVVIPAAAQQAKEKNDVETKPVIMLWSPNGALWQEDNDGVMQWKLDIPTGTELEGICTSGEDVEKKTAKRKASTGVEERNFYKVRYQGTEYWVQDALVSVNAKTGVISEDNALIYNAPTITGMGSTVLPIGTVVAVSNDEVSDKNFVKIDAKTVSNYIDVRAKFVKADKIVTNGDDVQVLQLLNLAKKAKNETVRTELLVNAKSLSPSAVVKKMLEDYENELNAASSPKTFTKTFLDETFYVQVSSNGDMMNIRKEPGTTGELAFKVADKAVLSVDGKTIENDEIDGKSAVWYHVYELTETTSPDGETPIWNRSGNEGWIFAGFVENYQMYQ